MIHFNFRVKRPAMIALAAALAASFATLIQPQPANATATVTATAITSMPAPTPAPKSAAASSGSTMVFVPLVIQAGRATPPVQPAPPAQRAFFVPGDEPTRGFDAAYDAAGGLHITYIAHSREQNGQRVIYAYCAPG